MGATLFPYQQNTLLSILVHSPVLVPLDGEPDGTYSNAEALSQHAGNLCGPN